MTPFKLLPFVAIFGVTACMSGDDAETPSPVLSFAELNLRQADLIQEIADAGPTPVAAIPGPAAGSVVYDGTLFLTLQDGSQDGVIGQSQLTANFASNTVAGGADNFYDLNGNATAGSLTLQNGAFDRLIGLVSGQMSGNVTFEAGAMDVDATVIGNFSGPNAEYVSGILPGTATPAGEDAINVVGGFYLEQ